MTGVKYLLRGRLGFQSDSEWDGDTFTKNPVDALVRDEPWSGGRISETYECVKIRFWEEVEPKHNTYIKAGMNKGKVRYRVICRRCSATTKAMGTIENAKNRFGHFPEVCIITKYEVLGSAKP